MEEHKTTVEESQLNGQLNNVDEHKTTLIDMIKQLPNAQFLHRSALLLQIKNEIVVSLPQHDPEAVNLLSLCLQAIDVQTAQLLIQKLSSLDYVTSQLVVMEAYKMSYENQPSVENLIQIQGVNEQVEQEEIPKYLPLLTLTVLQQYPMAADNLLLQARGDSTIALQLLRSLNTILPSLIRHNLNCKQIVYGVNSITQLRVESKIQNNTDIPYSVFKFCCQLLLHEKWIKDRRLIESSLTCLILLIKLCPTLKNCISSSLFKIVVGFMGKQPLAVALLQFTDCQQTINTVVNHMKSNKPSQYWIPFICRFSSTFGNMLPQLMIKLSRMQLSNANNRLFLPLINKMYKQGLLNQQHISNYMKNNCLPIDYFHNGTITMNEQDNRLFQGLSTLKEGETTTEQLLSSTNMELSEAIRSLSELISAQYEWQFQSHAFSARCSWLARLLRRKCYPEEGEKAVKPTFADQDTIVSRGDLKRAMTLIIKHLLNLNESCCVQYRPLVVQRTLDLLSANPSLLLRGNPHLQSVLERLLLRRLTQGVNNTIRNTWGYQIIRDSQLDSFNSTTWHLQTLLRYYESEQPQGMSLDIPEKDGVTLQSQVLREVYSVMGRMHPNTQIQLWISLFRLCKDSNVRMELIQVGNVRDDLLLTKVVALRKMKLNLPRVQMRVDQVLQRLWMYSDFYTESLKTLFK